MQLNSGAGSDSAGAVVLYGGSSESDAERGGDVRILTPSNRHMGRSGSISMSTGSSSDTAGMLSLMTGTSPLNAGVVKLAVGSSQIIGPGSDVSIQAGSTDASDAVGGMLFLQRDRAAKEAASASWLGRRRWTTVVKFSLPRAASATLAMAAMLQLPWVAT